MLAYNASSVPILQLVLSSATLPNRRSSTSPTTSCAPNSPPCAGASMPYPFGGKPRQVQVDLDPAALRANGLSADDVVTAIGSRI